MLARFLLSLFAFSLLALLSTGVATAQTAVFINEIHYDNASTDTGEAIEVGGPAGTDLTGWSIVLYNGNGGAVYNSTNLGGVIGDLQGGFGVVSVSYPSNGIQTGRRTGSPWWMTWATRSSFSATRAVSPPSAARPTGW